MSTPLFPAYVESERLRYEPLHETIDVLDLYEYHRAGEMDAVMRALGETPHATPKETMDELATCEETWDACERATYAITLQETDEFVGVAELWLEWEQRKTSFGIWLREPFWGRGFSGERAGAMLYVAFQVLDLDIVSASHERGNDRSKRSIEAYVDVHGGQYDGILRNGLPPGEFGGPRDLHVYSISQAQWRENVTDAALATIRVDR